MLKSKIIFKVHYRNEKKQLLVAKCILLTDTSKSIKIAGYFRDEYELIFGCATRPAPMGGRGV